jgi:hypothetical protein
LSIWQREPEREPVDSNLEDSWDQTSAESDDRVDRPVGEQQPDGTAQHRKHQTFDDELSHDVGAARPERKSRGNLAPPPGEAGKLQIGDVGAGDQQDAANRGKQQQIALALVADRIVEQRDNLNFRRASTLAGFAGGSFR